MHTNCSTLYVAQNTLQNTKDRTKTEECLKKYLKERYSNYENSLKLVGLETLFQRREKWLYNFGKKCINIEQTKHLFIRKKTDNPMKKRTQETYEVIHANTERLRNSTVPYIQRLMNRKIMNKE